METIGRKLSLFCKYFQLNLMCCYGQKTVSWQPQPKLHTHLTLSLNSTEIMRRLHHNSISTFIYQDSFSWLVEVDISRTMQRIAIFLPKANQINGSIKNWKFFSFSYETIICYNYLRSLKQLKQLTVLEEIAIPSHTLLESKIQKIKNKIAQIS